MQQIVLLNGPARSGKDEAAKIFEKEFGFEHTKFAKILKERAHALFGLTYPGSNLPYAHDHFESTKDQSNESMEGMTPRQAYIWFSEEVIKPKFGKRWFAAHVADHVARRIPFKLALSDTGFKEEYEVFCNRFGNAVVLVQIHRPGFSFEGDSRDYVTPLGSEGFFLLNNDGTLEQYRNNVRLLAKSIINAAGPY